MKANELADIQAFKSEELTMWERNTTATMLRQQQAEIEALKQIIDANNLNQNIGQFVKPINEPVAWAYIKDGDFFDAVHPDEHEKYEGMYTTPLYTHPVKELTDEEIKFIAYPFESVYTTYDKQTDTDTVHIRFDQLGFARAILKKAKE